ncbi:MAG: ATP-binding protein, partial [Bacteroidota bacterium]
MKRYFNTTGRCVPKDHYMVPPFRGMDDDILRLIEAKQYFLIHAPRQTGKTTFLHAFAHRLNREGTYICLVVSVERAGVPSMSEAIANERMIKALWRMCPDFLPEEEFPPAPRPGLDMTDYLTEWTRAQSKPIVLLIDEVDALWDDVLVSFLRQLRDGFQTRPESFPQSIALVGLRDIRDYKLKAREGNPSLGSGSPFNVKAKSFFLPFFSREEVRGLLDQHTADTGQVFSEAVFEEIFTYTQGQPWLTNALANHLVEEMLRRDYSRPITPEMVEIAKEALIAERQTHLDSLVDKVQEPRVRKVVN